MVGHAIIRKKESASLQGGFVLKSSGGVGIPEKEDKVSTPLDASVWSKQGDALCELGRMSEAVDCYDKALAIDPEDAYTWVSRGIILRDELDSYEEALESFNHAVDIEPKNPWYWYHRGEALYRLGEYQKAVESYERAIELEGENSDWEAVEKKEEALEKLKTWLKDMDSVQLERDNLATVKDAEIFLREHRDSELCSPIRQEYRVSEHLLHEFIRKKLEKAYGNGWRERGIPEHIRKICAKRQKQNPRYFKDWYDCISLIHLKTVLDIKWRLFEIDFQLLRGEFGSKIEFLSVLDKLNNIRILVDHNRGGGLTEDDLNFARRMRKMIEKFTGV